MFGTNPSAWMVAVLLKTLLTVVLPSLTWNEMRVTEPIASGFSIQERRKCTSSSKYGN